MTPVSEREGGVGTSNLQLRDVGLEIHGHRIFWGADVTVEEGIPVVVTGPSGSGKTLLCMVLAGLIAPTTGEVLMAGRPIVEGSAPQVGVVIQDHGLVSALTALENVALPLQERRMEGSEVAERSRTALGLVGLVDEADRLVDHLSGGERQRVGIARAIAGDPPVLVADEPTSELDPENRERVLRLLVDGGRHPSIVVVASDDPEVAKHFERVFVLGDGSVAELAQGGTDHHR